MTIDEKKLLEKYAVEYFQKAYPRELKIEKHSDKPDFTLTDETICKKIGVEVAHLWHDKNEAKILLGRFEKINHGVMNANDLIITLNELLSKKVKKTSDYKMHNKLFLVIRVASPIFDKSTFDMYEDLIICPKNEYDEIWLVLSDNNKVEKWTELKQIK